MLKAIFIFIIIVHALIHFMGFSKAFGYGNITQLTKEISKPIGILWLITALIFIICIALFLFKKDSWIYFSLIAVVLSQILIIMVWKDAKFGTILNAVILSVAISAWATYRFKMVFEADVKNRISRSNFSNTDLLELLHR